MALEHAASGAGLVVVPSSDWRGIDPYHTQMARLRAIEGGFSVFRPVRAATSAAFDAYGRMRASMPFFENNSRVFTASVPTERVPTLYAVIGDSPAVLCGSYLLMVWAIAMRGRREPASS